jgi:serine/threonine protein phosphatase PrpC
MVGRDMLAPEFVEIDGHNALAAVADGMGGGPGGREAAFLVLTKLSELTQAPLTDDGESLIAQNLKDAAKALTMVAQRNPALKQMGAVVAGLWLAGEKALAFNCGDSRVYRIREGFLDLLTKDHSLVYELYVNGQIKEEAMAGHPLKNILTSSIQDEAEAPQVFFRRTPLSFGDSFLICTDGVWDSASRAELEGWAALGPEEGSRLLAASLTKKAEDNCTFIWLYDEAPPPEG